jgi:hypothetical protein
MANKEMDKALCPERGTGHFEPMSEKPRPSGAVRFITAIFVLYFFLAIHAYTLYTGEFYGEEKKINTKALHRKVAI